MKRSPLTLFVLALGTITTAVQSDPVFWNQFRGPNGSGVGPFKPPIQITRNARAWTVRTPAGHSSPVLWGDRLFLTGIECDRLVTLALDKRSGAVLWKKLTPKVRLERVHSAGSPAASTPCADSSKVYVHFGSYGLLCYDHDGREQWARPLPTPKSMYGTSSSPILHEDRIVLVLDDDTDLPDSALSRSRVVAFDRRTGEPVWETPRPYNRSGWSTPILWKHDAATDLIVLGNGRVYGYDPITGAEKWYVNGFSRETISTPVVGDHKLYLSASMQGGRGDEQLDPEPFWKAMLQFDRNGDQQIARDEINEHFTLPFRPELPLGHPGFGLPLPSDPVKRRERQDQVFDWRDRNGDGVWTRDEFQADMAVGRGKPNLAAVRPGGHGDITDTHVAWTLRSGIPEIPSPVFHNGRLYFVRDGGILISRGLGVLA